MKIYKGIITAGASILGIFVLIAAISLVKVWLVDHGKAASKTAAEAEIITETGITGLDPTTLESSGASGEQGSETNGSRDTEASTGQGPETGVLQDSEATDEQGSETTLVQEPQTGPEQTLETTSQAVTEPIEETSSGQSLESSTVTASGRDPYHNLLSKFTESSLKDLGFSLCSDWYTPAGEKGGNENVAILYYTGSDKTGYEEKKQAAIRLSKYIYGEFERVSGFKTDYLKVHLKQPEGDSFALTRDSYMKWASAGASDGDLFEQFMSKMIEPDTTVKEEGKVFSAIGLEGFLNSSDINGLKFKVEGDARINPGIYITMDKEKSSISESDYEDTVILLCAKVFRVYLQNTGEQVNAFKLMEPSGNVVFVIYRSDVDTLWPEGSDTNLRQFIKDGKTGPMS